MSNKETKQNMNPNLQIPLFSLSSIPEGLAGQLGITAFEGGLLASVILLVIVMFPLFILTMKARNNAVLPVMLTIGIALFMFEVAIGWMPVFMVVALMLVAAILIAMKVPDIFGGKS